MTTGPVRLSHYYPHHVLIILYKMKALKCITLGVISIVAAIRTLAHDSPDCTDTSTDLTSCIRGMADTPAELAS